MKPLSEPTYVDQALRNGKGVTWLKSRADGVPRFAANLIVSDGVLGPYSQHFALEETLPFLIAPKPSRREKRPIRTRCRQVEHPTVKPLTLMTHLIALASKPGDVVLDPFLGSGTTAIAAKLLKRHYIGIERDSGYVALARARLAQGVVIEKRAAS